MGKIKVKRIYRCDCANDVNRIRHALLMAGYDVTLTEAMQLWEEYSGDICAAWITVPNNNREIVEIVERYIETDWQD